MDDEDQDRVKIYQMDDEGVWLDQGTGRVSLSDSLMVVTSEVEPPTVMLKCMIRNIEFSRQQESLLMWTENNKELALSFQIQEKCDQIWDEIVEVQKKYTEFVEDLPKPSTNNLDTLEKIFVLGKGQREFFLDKLENSEFISDLMLVYKELLNECAGGVSIEDIDQDPTGSEKIKEIKQKFCQLSIVVKYLVFLNSETILNRIFHLDFLTMLEILEYDQEYSHSNFSKMFQQQNLKTVFDIDDENLLNLMLDTQKAMFIKDVVLARALEDATFLFLTSYISKNQALIVNYFISHPDLLQKLMEICKYNDCLEEIDVRKAVESFSMLNELLTLSKACEKDEQQNLYAQLTNNQIFTIIHSHLSFPNAKVELKTCILTVLSKVVEYSSNSYREFLLKSDNFKHFANIYLSEHDDCLQYHWFEIFKSLLTTSQQSNSFSSYETLFIAFVYGGPILDFFRPILEYQKGNSNSSSILVSLELVLYTVENHSAHLRKLMLEHDIFEALIQVLNSPSVHLQSCINC